MIKPPLTDQQREVLMRLLHGLGLTIGRYVEIGRRIVSQTTYGTIAFEHWKSEWDALREEIGKTETADYEPPARYCEECKTNHEWDELCPKLIAESHCTRCGCNHSADEDCEQMREAK